jgi:hypothetical protein
MRQKLAGFPAGAAILAAISGIAKKPANERSSAIHRAVKRIIRVKKKTAIFGIGTGRRKITGENGIGPFALVRDHPCGKIQGFHFKNIGFKAAATGAASGRTLKGTSKFPGFLLFFCMRIYRVKALDQKLCSRTRKTVCFPHCVSRKQKYTS